MKTCRYDPYTNQDCPVFRLGDIVQWSGQENYNSIAFQVIYYEIFILLFGVFSQIRDNVSLHVKFFNIFAYFCIQRKKTYQYL